MFFWISKITTPLISPDSLIVLLTLLGCFFIWRGSYKKAKIVITVVAAVMLLISFVCIGCWLRYPLETRFIANPQLPQRIDGIIMLAGPERPSLSNAWKQAELKDGAERYMAFMALARRYPRAKLVFSGGSGSMTEQEYKAADIADDLFAQQGLDISRIVFERESRNTYENAVFSKERAKPSLGENWVLVTSASHMPRSVGVFCKQGWPVIPFPVDHGTKPELNFPIGWNFSGHLDDLVWAVYEWLGLLAYDVTGRIDSIYPDGCL